MFPTGMSHWLTAAGMGALCVGSLFVGGRSPAAAGAKLDGVIYSAAASSGTPTSANGDPWQQTLKDGARYPEVNLSFDPETAAQLPKADSFLVHVVPSSPETTSLTLARARSEHKSRPARKPALLAKPNPLPAPPIAATPAPEPALPKAPAPPAPIAAAAPVVPAPPPKPTQPVTFAEFDGALRGNPTTEAINRRKPLGGVAFRLTHVGVVGDRAVVRYAISNTESRDFFVSIVNVTANGTPIQAEPADQQALVCGAGGTEIPGIVHFARADVVGKTVSIELIQSGGERRRFPLDVPYTF